MRRSESGNGAGGSVGDDDGKPRGGGGLVGPESTKTRECHAPTIAIICVFSRQNETV